MTETVSGLHEAERQEAANESFIRRSLDSANLNVLRMAIYQVTKDPALAAMKTEKQPVRRGAMVADTLPAKYAEEVKQKAFNFLTGSERSSTSTSPPVNQIRQMMEMFGGEPITDEKFQFGLEELAFDDFPRDVTWNAKPADSVIQAFHVLIIGAGISGLAAAIQLERLGIPYSVLERRERLGGTWWINDYPDARVDTSSYLYQFKFEKRYPWSEYCASRDETRKYLEYLAQKHGVIERFRFRTEVLTATWDDTASKWRVKVRTHDGAETILEANVLISATGTFANANLPDIAGIGDFEGRIFHTTTWDHSYDYKGKRVALIGTGSTGTQLMPVVATAAESLTVYQRTPNWITELDGYREKVSREARWLFDNVPFYWNWFCYSSYVIASQLQEMQTYDREWQKAGGMISERNDKFRSVLTEYIKSKIGDRPDLLKKCLPTNAPLGRRLVVDSGWYDALRRDNVELVNDGIERVTRTGIRSNDGYEREFDLIILGTGFRVSQYLSPVKYMGRHGVTLDGLWKKDGPRSYLGLVLPGLPNFFMYYGPHGQPRAGGFYSWAEVWTRYILKSIIMLLETGSRSMDCHKTTYDEYNRRLDEANNNLIWEGEGRGGYYLTAEGRSCVNLPWTTYEYHSWLIEPNRNDFDIR